MCSDGGRVDREEKIVDTGGILQSSEKGTKRGGAVECRVGDV